MVLINETEVIAAQCRPHPVAEFAAFHFVKRYFAFARPVQQPGNLQQGRLSRTRRADQRHNLARHNLKINAFQHLQILASLLKAFTDFFSDTRSV